LALENLFDEFFFGSSIYQKRWHADDVYLQNGCLNYDDNEEGLVLSRADDFDKSQISRLTSVQHEAVHVDF
jgi:hypothetical protein